MGEERDAGDLLIDRSYFCFVYSAEEVLRGCLQSERCPDEGSREYHGPVDGADSSAGRVLYTRCRRSDDAGPTAAAAAATEF